MRTGKDNARALVLNEFGKPFSLDEFPLPEPGYGEVLARVTAAGICGSDIHEREGHDPRTPLPIIPGHEGVGEVFAEGDDATLCDGGSLEPGMPIVWERSLTCGKCYFCLRNKRFLCVERKVYGINISCAEPPYLSGNYATHILLRAGTSIYKRNEKFDPSVLVSATCSGTTAAHAHEYTGIKGGETVLIYGSGPVALWGIAFALDSGAKWVKVVTRSPGPKSEIARAFGADEIFFRSENQTDEIIAGVVERTGGMGVDVTIDTTADPSNFREAVSLLCRGGVYVNPGLAIPSQDIPLNLFGDVVNKNLRINGVWASDASHLRMAMKLLESGRFPFEKLVTHRFQLEEHEEAWRVLTEKEGVKVVFEP
ncbi:MAG TPA: alcohol dehydrogenase [Firmicutes bacterium]|nr:alcohol dehydrogenase [Bacillota bacterium]